MSKAFTKEDDAPLERSNRMRSTSGLPPGAVNYITADGALRLRAELAALKDDDVGRTAEIERILASATIVEPPVERPAGAVFGAMVEVRDPVGKAEFFRIVGVDEVNLDPRWVNWTSATGRSLLGAEPGQRVTLEVDGEERRFVIVRIDY